ncbi:glycosyltransferase [Conexibacter sp. W3-3-2]|nr:glycosyltransferase [Conexibacter sp. W3-3-2]
MPEGAPARMGPLSAHAAPAVTVAVVSWNTRDLLDACLRALEPEHAAGRAAVVVVDNGSGDGSPALVRDAHPWAALVERFDNPGFGTAANVALAGARTPYVAVANADTAVTPGALDALLAAAARHGDAVLAPCLRTPGGGIQHSVHPFPSLRQVAAVDLGLARVLPGEARRLALEGAWDPGAGRTVDWAHGAFLLLPRALWERLGGFDPSMWMYAEDLDLCWRAARAGAPTRYVPDAVVEHHVAASTTQAWGAGRLQRSQRAAHAWSRRRLGPARTAAWWGLAIGAGVVRSAALTVAARLAPVGYGWRRDRARALLAARLAARREGS